MGAGGREEMIRGAPIGARFANCTFDNYEVTEKNREPYEACKQLAEKGGAGVLLIGKYGVGKTHLLIALMKAFDAGNSASTLARDMDLGGDLVKVPPMAELFARRETPEGPEPTDSAAPRLAPDEIARDAHIEYWPVLDLVCELRHEVGRGSQELSWRCRDCDLLVLDDLGAERVTDFVLEELERIVDWRYRTMKPTAIATNLGFTGIIAKYGQKSLSRWVASCQPFTVLGEDRRASMKPS
jgi:DNA replication protein DnaC